MKRYVIRRIARVVAVVALVSLAVFTMLQLAPGGPAGIMAGDRNLSEADLARMERNLGIDKPLPVQYLVWLRRVFLGFDFGTSYATGEPVARMIVGRIPATLELMGAAFVIAVVLGIPLGVLSALRRDSFADQVGSVIAAAGMSMPVFWLGIIAIYIFSLRFGLLPSGGRETIGGSGIADHLRHLVLPACVLSVGFLATWSRYVRAQVLEAIGGDFVRTARAKGLAERTVVWKHVLRPSLIPVLTAIVMHLPALFTGAVITETVFSWPGMGRMFYDGLARHDYPRVLGVVVVSSFLVILFNLAGDLLNAAVDPRISLGRAAGEGGTAGCSGDAGA